MSKGSISSKKDLYLISHSRLFYRHLSRSLDSLITKRVFDGFFFFWGLREKVFSLSFFVFFQRRDLGQQFNHLLFRSLMTLNLIDEHTKTKGDPTRECIGQGESNDRMTFFFFL